MMKKYKRAAGKKLHIAFWDYRVIRKQEMGTIVYAIHEVYYNDRNKPVACTVEPVEPQGETLKEFKEDMKHYLLALEKPVLKYEKIRSCSDK